MRGWRAPALVAVLVVVLGLAFVTLWAPTDSVSANPLGDIAAVSAGEGHTCALTTDGGLKCWGDNQFGQLGNGTTESSTVPVDVVGLSSGVVQVSAGLAQSCAVTTAGGVKCWGSGYLGTGTSEQSSTPVDVVGLTSGVSQVDVGYQHSCVVTAAGGAKCWGINGGRLGDGTLLDRPTPVDVEGLETAVVAIDAGFEHTCAVTFAGGVKCWGDNQFGELGDGTTLDRLVPVDVAGLTGAVAVAAGLNHTCALTDSGGAKCWGYRYGATPTNVAGLTSGAAAIGSLYNHTCALTTEGGVKCWGANDYGQLGDGFGCGLGCAAPADVVGLASGATGIGVGVNHTCAVTDSGNAKCWGNNYVGQLGNGIGSIGSISAIPTDVVQQESKAPPCEPSSCPTPPQRPVPRDGLDYSIGADTDRDGMEDCGTKEGQQPGCVLPVGGTFSLIVSLNSLPPDMHGYAGFDLVLEYAAVAASPTAEVVWPDCTGPVFYYGSGLMAIGCSLGGSFESTYVGPVGQATFACARTGSITLLHGFGNTSLVEWPLRVHHESPSGGETLMITCGDLVHGDVDCSVIVDAIDAGLMLQREAAIVDWLSCPQHADVNLDNRANSIDAVVTLQYTAGLVASLPPQLAGR